MSITVVIIAITCIVSFMAFSNQKLMDDLIFYPPAITNQKQWYRFFTCGFIHADIPHLAFNMYSYYMFGEAIEEAFEVLFGIVLGKILYLFLYLSSLAVCLLPTYLRNKTNYYYKSLGASGAVSAIVFAFIFLQPLAGISLIFIPIPGGFPAFVFGFVYLGITYYLDKRGNSSINHSAHFWGALYGILFLIVACLLLSHFNPVTNFWMQVQYKVQTYFR